MIYFIQGEQTKRIKIGKTDSVLGRLKLLQCGSPDRLTVLKVITNEANDHLYHTQFKADQVYGEWFSASDTVMAFISEIPTSKFDGLTYMPRSRVAECVPIVQRLFVRPSLPWRHTEIAQYVSEHYGPYIKPYLT